MRIDEIDAESGPVRRRKTFATAMFVLVLLSPALRNGDGVPLSSYPMYAVPRDEVLDFVVPVAVTSEGVGESLSTWTIAETRDPLVAENYLRTEVARGRAPELCEQIAERVGDEAIRRIEVWIEVHNVVDRVRGQDSLVDKSLISSCSR